MESVHSDFQATNINRFAKEEKTEINFESRIRTNRQTHSVVTENKLDGIQFDQLTDAAVSHGKVI
jgi:hypothetical protein